jgi:hypothetical protein
MVRCNVSFRQRCNTWQPVYRLLSHWTFNVFRPGSDGGGSWTWSFVCLRNTNAIAVGH